MAEITADTLISVFYWAPLNRRYWVTFGLLSIREDGAEVRQRAATPGLVAS